MRGSAAGVLAVTDAQDIQPTAANASAIQGRERRAQRTAPIWRSPWRLTGFADLVHPGSVAQVSARLGGDLV
jgi:hypothetical protein